MIESKELEQLKKHICWTFGCNVCKLIAELERLRSALELIGNHVTWYDKNKSGDPVCHTYGTVVQIAREALGVKDE